MRNEITDEGFVAEGAPTMAPTRFITTDIGAKNRPLEGKVAIVTGASSGIGFETALEMARAGAKVVVGARREEKLGKLLEALRKEDATAEKVVMDVTKEEVSPAHEVVADVTLRPEKG